MPPRSLPHISSRQTALLLLAIVSSLFLVASTIVTVANPGAVTPALFGVAAFIYFLSTLWSTAHGLVHAASESMAAVVVIVLVTVLLVLLLPGRDAGAGEVAIATGAMLGILLAAILLARAPRWRGRCSAMLPMVINLLTLSGMLLAAAFLLTRVDD